MRSSLFSGLFLVACCWFFSVNSVSAEPADPKTTQEISDLLVNFLTHNDQRAIHDSFWAADVIYTSSEGKVRRKPDIMKSLDERTAASAATDKSLKGPPYSAEDIVVRTYGEMAALTFRLVANNADGSHAYFRNSGTFLRRDGKWQAVTWQATKASERD